MPGKVVFKMGFWKDLVWIPAALSTALMISLAVFWWEDFGDGWNVFLIWGLFLISYIWSVYRSFTFRVLEDGIELKNPFSGRPTQFIPNDAIHQVRFEDGFEHFSGSKYIIVYLREPMLKRGMHPDRIRLFIGGPARYKRITPLLKHFVDLGLDVKILTSHRGLQKALGIQNWDRPSVSS